MATVFGCSFTVKFFSGRVPTCDETIICVGNEGVLIKPCALILLAIQFLSILYVISVAKACKEKKLGQPIAKSLPSVINLP